MINIYTVTEDRSEIAEVWSAALKMMLQTPYKATVYYQTIVPNVSDNIIKIPLYKQSAPMRVMRQYMVQDGVRMFLEEDMIPVLPWKIEDYPGSLLFAEGCDKCAWPSLTISRVNGSIGFIRLGSYQLVPQRFVRDGGCPEWLPQEYHELALKGNCKVLGNHFLHLDKMYNSRVDPETAEAKNQLLQLLRNKFIGSGQ